MPRCWPGARPCCTRASPWAPRTPGAFWRVVAEHGIKALFTAPTAFRAIKKEDPDGKLLQRVRPVRVQVPVPGRRAARPRDLPVGGPAARHPGHRPLVADRDRLADRRRPDGPGAAADQARLAHRADARLRRPHPGRRRGRGEARRRPGRSWCGCRCRRDACPPCGATTSGSSAPTCRQHPGFYTSGDGGYRDGDGYLYVMGRIDDVINVAGHRLSTGQMEEVLASHPAVAECAVIGVDDDVQGPGTARVRGAQGGRQHRSGRRCPPSSSSWSGIRSGRSPRCAGST